MIQDVARKATLSALIDLSVVVGVQYSSKDNAGIFNNFTATGDTCEHDNDTGAFACLNPKNGNFDSPVSAVLTSIKLPPTLTATLTATEETSTPTITTTLTAVDSATKTLTAVDSATKTLTAVDSATKTLPPTIAETLTAGDSDTKTLPPTTTNTFFDSILNPELL
ncbi:hypothetical protein C0993_008870, partial [Termitomyces sp. T159_Od127]